MRFDQQYRCTGIWPQGAQCERMRVWGSGLCWKCLLWARPPFRCASSGELAKALGMNRIEAAGFERRINGLVNPPRLVESHDAAPSVPSKEG